MRAPFIEERDVVVLGGGSAGVSAAVSAARLGASVAIVERLPFFGGMATAAEVGTVCGLYYRSTEKPTPAHGGIVAEFASRLEKASGLSPQVFAEGLWFLPYRPLEFGFLCDDLVRESGVLPLLHAAFGLVEMEDNRVAAVHGMLWDRPFELHGRVFIDATGEAVAAEGACEEPLEGAERQAGAIVFTLGDLATCDPQILHRALLRETARGIRDGALPEAAQFVSVVPGGISEDSARIKLSLPAVQALPPGGPGALEIHARKLVAEVAKFLRGSAGEFSGCRLSSVAAQCGIRTGPRFRGRDVLFDEDVLGCRERADGIARGTWPVEIWGGDRRPEMRYFEAGRHYHVPLGALRARRTSNLFFAGRGISASDGAIASARVIGTCLATGAAAGMFAALSLEGRSEGEAVAKIRGTLFADSEA